MEEIKFDDLERVSLKKEVFLKLPLLRKYVYSEENFERLIRYLHDIHLQQADRILDAISYVNDELVKKFGQRISSEPEPLYYSSLLWEWIYLLAYYLHQIDLDPLWIENFLPHMKKFQIRPAALNEMNQGEKLINEYIDIRLKVLETQRKIDNPTAETCSQQTTDVETQQLSERFAELEQQLADKDAEIERLNARIKELEEQLNVVHLSFIETEGKNPDSIKWAYNDIKKAIGSPAEMAECLHRLQVQGMLKNQERYGKLKKIKKIYDELEETYHFEWTYPALCRALTRLKTK